MTGGVNKLIECLVSFYQTAGIIEYQYRVSIRLTTWQPHCVQLRHVQLKFTVSLHGEWNLLLFQCLGHIIING